MCCATKDDCDWFKKSKQARAFSPLWHDDKRWKGHIWCHRTCLDPTFCICIQLSIRKKSVKVKAAVETISTPTLSSVNQNALHHYDTRVVLCANDVIFNFSWLEKPILPHLLCNWYRYSCSSLSTHMFNPRCQCNTFLPVLWGLSKGILENVLND